MTASHNLELLKSDAKNPCPICGRTKDGDCRRSRDGQLLHCWHGKTHHPPQGLHPSKTIDRNGLRWAYTGETSCGSWAVFTINKPKDSSRPYKAVPFRSPSQAQVTSPNPQQIAIPGAIELAHREPVDFDPAKRRWRYSPTQGTKRVDNASGKSFVPHHLVELKWRRGAGPDPWPAYCEVEASQACGYWLLEAEGEKCADIIRAGGRVAISQPGHAHKVEQIKDRYRRLVGAGVQGIVYLEDNDEQGRQRSSDSAEAATAAGLPLLVLPAATVWPGLPEKGSIDDTPGTAADRVAEIEAAIVALLEHQGELEKGQPGQVEQLDALLGPEQEGRLRKPPKDLLTQVVEAVVPLRFNQLTNRIENDGQPVDGDFLGTLYLQLAERYAIDVQKERAADAALLVSRRRTFHPVRLYLQDLESRSICLPAEDWATLDARVFGGEVSGGWGIVHLQRQLIAAVARAMQPGCEVHTALVLHSDQQGIGKSSLWKILGGAWFSDSLGDLKDLKEDRLQLHSAWIHEWGEIDAVMGKRDSETLKRFLSCSQDDVRRPYGRGTEQLKRSCVIVGTTNRRDFIKDPTGNRRFPIISIQQVNTPWIKEHRDAIWGSALAAYKAGERWHYTDQENAHINDAALAFAAEDPLRDQIETWAEDHPDVQEAPLARILPEAGCTPSGEPPDQKLVQRASSVMRSLGWRRADKKRRYLLPDGDRTDNTWGWLRDAA